jgi:protein involved in polysaccharide export with SLBB domain
MRLHIAPFCFALLVGCASGSDLPTCTESAAPQSAAAAEETVDAYVLGTGDRMRITVFRNPELSGEFAIGGEGYLALPLGGEVLAKGLNVRQLEDQIETRFREGGFLVDPQVSVEVLTYRPFYILGEVANPGQYQYVNGMTVTTAVAMAGGFTYRGDQDDITIERGDCAISAQVGTPVLPGEVITVHERFF